MTNEEIIQKFALEEYPENISYSTVIEKMVDYFDYRGLIEKGLVLAALEGMYD